MTPLLRLSPFIEPVAVEAWDAWFRWRERGELHDVSIEDTWRRVAVTLASTEAEGGQRRWLARFLNAFARWRLLPDERLLAAAGTGAVTWRDGELHAALNLAAFVPADAHSTPRVDPAAIGECAEVAVRALDNAALLAGIAVPELRIGMVGVADALLLLGLDYDSYAGRAQAAAFARAVAEGCLRANVVLARERGATPDGTRQAIARVRKLELEWQRDAERHGLRHRELTAITSQPRLALLANDVADALDPLLGRIHWHTIAGPEGPRSIQSAGYALGVLHADGDPQEHDHVVPRNLSTAPQLAMHAAVQPWIDAPIDCPLLLEAEPGPAQQAEARTQAEALGLGAPTWRTPSALQGREATAQRASRGMYKPVTEATP